MNIKKIKAVSFLLIIIVLSHCEIHASLSKINFIYSTSENIIDASTSQGIVFNGFSLTGGGDIITDVGNDCNECMMMVSFGQPFASQAFGNNDLSELVNEGNAFYQQGAKFLNDEKIVKFGTVDDLETLDGNYSNDKLNKAESYYRGGLLQAYNTNPSSNQVIKATLGILKIRQAKLIKSNLVWDIKRRLQLRLRLTDITNADIIKKEIQVLEYLANLQKDAIADILELFFDSQPLGPGEVLRREFIISNANDPDGVVEDTFQLIFSTCRRISKTHLVLAQKRLFLDFFNENERSTALTELANAYAYLIELIRLLNPYIDQSNYDITEALQMTTMQSKMTELSGFIEQGYNPFGFLPDFVPFVSGGTDDSNLSVFNKMKKIADAAVEEAKKKEEYAKNNETLFAQNNAEYLERMESLKTSYYQRLKSIVGVVVDGSGEEKPDLITFMLPDKDLSNDGITERDANRNYLASKYGWIFKSKGQIGLQYNTIATAEERIEAVNHDLKSVSKEIDIRINTTKAILNIHENIASIILENGEKVNLFIKEKGELQKKTAQKIANEQKNDNMFTWLYEKGKNIVSKIENYFQDKFKKRQPKEPVTLAAIVGVAQLALPVVNGIMATNSASEVSTIQGQLSLELANIDAEINKIQTIMQAEIEMARGNIEAIRTEQEVQLLLLRKARLELNVSMAQRDLNREMNALKNLLAEVGTLSADYVRAIKLAETNFQNVSLGWQENDVHDVLTKSVLIADKAFFRAQVWTFVALRALEYYANLPPDANGQPNAQIRTLYNRLYKSRRGDDLQSLLSEMQTKATSNFVFTITNTAQCPLRGILSLKYDVFAPTIVSYDDKGLPTNSGIHNEEYYHYSDPITGMIYQGTKAYQVMFRNALRNGLTGIEPKRTLQLFFSTDLFPRPHSEGIVSENPFYLATATNAKIVGFTNFNCEGQGFLENVQGIQVNLTGSINDNSRPFIKIAQLGNSYLKHSQWTIEDLDEKNQPINPLKFMTVYSTYQQLLPTWLIGDINNSTQNQESMIGSAVRSSLVPLIKGQGPSKKVLEFTDRSVANDRWELTIHEWDKASNINFFDELEKMLSCPVDEFPHNEFLTDIQLWIGWAYRDPSVKRHVGYEREMK